jgi:hypothetical protein
LVAADEAAVDAAVMPVSNMLKSCAYLPPEKRAARL